MLDTGIFVGKLALSVVRSFHRLTNKRSTVFGPKLGTRAMVTSRFSWGCACHTFHRLYDTAHVRSQVLRRNYSKHSERLFFTRLLDFRRHHWRTSPCFRVDTPQRYRWNRHHFRDIFSRDILGISFLALVRSNYYPVYY